MIRNDTTVVKAVQAANSGNDANNEHSTFAPPTLTQHTLKRSPQKLSDYDFMHKHPSVFNMVMDSTTPPDVALKVFDECGYLFRVSMLRPTTTDSTFNVYIAKIPKRVYNGNSRNNKRTSKLVYHNLNHANLSTTSLFSMEDVDKVIAATVKVLKHVSS